MLDEDREFRDAARAAGTTIWDVREPPDVPLFSRRRLRRRGAGAAYRRQRLRGRQDDGLARARVARQTRRARTRASFRPVRPACSIAGWGISVDRVISDFAPGAAEQLVLYAAREGADLDRRRGTRRDQSSRVRPVTLALMTGLRSGRASCWSAIPRRRQIESVSERRPYPTRTASTCTSDCLQTLKPAQVMGIALNTRGLSETSARAEIARRARARRDCPPTTSCASAPQAFYAADRAADRKASAAVDGTRP